VFWEGGGMTIELTDPTDGGVVEVEVEPYLTGAAQDELHAPAYSLAYEMAESIICSESLTWRDETDQPWLEVEPEGEAELFDALRYLELRGLLERHPENHNRVQVRDESQATA
jgi:hypothetical protein